MTTCLLCLAPSVTKSFCLSHDALVWAAELWMDNPKLAAWYARTEPGSPFALSDGPRRDALCWMDGSKARAVLDRLKTARETRLGDTLADMQRAKELWLAYMRGWYDGAGVRAICEDMSEHPRTGQSYIEGYTDGRSVGRRVAEEAAERYGCKPLVLKTAADEGSDEG